MGLNGKKVADAFIEVHGDLSDFRKDLEKANSQMQALAIENADNFADAWDKRVGQKITSSWNSLIDGLHTGDQSLINEMIGKFDPSDLDSASEKIHDLLNDMQIAGKLTDEQYANVKKTIDDSTKAMQRQGFIEAQLNEDRARWDRAHEVMMSRLADARDRDAKQMSDAIEMNRVYDRTFEGMIKTVQRGNLSRDFQSMADAMANADFSKFAKGFDSFPDLRRRVMEVTTAMVEQGRMSRENAAAVSGAAHQYILGEEAKLKATQDALDATRALREEQDRYNRSLDGMINHSKLQQMEKDFRAIADAMASGDWDKISNGSKDINATTDRLRSMAVEMSSAGRITAEQFRQITKELDKMSAAVKDVNQNVEAMGRIFGNVHNTMTSLKDGAEGLQKSFARVGAVTKGLREHLGGFAGANVFGDMIASGLDFIHNLDRIALSASQVTLKLGAMAAVGGSSVAGLAVIVGDLVDSFGGLGLLLPAFATGLGLMLFTTGAALASLKKKFKTVFGEIKTEMGDAMFTAMDPAFDRFNNALLPTLKTNLSKTAASMGLLYGSIFDGITNSVTPAQMDTMFARLNGAIEKSRTGTGALVHAWAVLGLTGSAYFDRVAESVNKLGTRFDHFISTAANNGDLDKWIEAGIKGFKDMGRSLDGVFGIFNAIESAARAAGSGGLSEFADKLQRLAAAMQAARFQATLTTLITGMNTATASIGSAIAGLGPALESAMPAISRALVNIGDTAATIIGYVGKILYNPAVQQGITDFTRSMKDAADALAPAIKPFGDSLGNALTLLGKITVSVAEIVTAFTVNLSPVLDSMSGKMSTLIDPLRNSAKKVIEAITPVLTQMDQSIVGPMVAIVRDKILPAFDDLVAKLSPAFVQIVKDLGPAFVAFGDALPNVLKFAGELVGPLTSLVGLLTPTLATTIEKIGSAFGNLANDIRVFKGELPVTELSVFKNFDPETMNRQGEEMRQSITDNLSGRGKTASWSEIISDAFWGQSPDVFWAKVYSKLGPSDEGGRKWNESVGKWLEGARSGIADLFRGADQNGGINEAVNNWFKDNVVKPWEDGIDSVLNGNFGSTDVGADRWNEFVSRPIQDFKDALGSVDDKGGLNETVNKWFDDTLFKPIREGWDSAWKSLGEWWAGVKTEFQKWMSGLLGFDTVFKDDTSVSGGGAGGKGMGVGSKIEKAWQMDDMSFMDRFKEAVTTKWNEFWAGVGETIATKGAEFKAGWDGFWGGFGETLGTKWEEFKTTVSTKFGELQAGAATGWEGFKTGWDGFWTDTGTTLSTKWEEFKTTVGTKAGEIKTGVDTWASGVKTGWDGFWGGVGDTLSTKWGEFTNTTGTKAGEIKSGIESFAGDVGKNWDALWGGAGKTIADKWGEFTKTSSSGTGDIQSDVSGMGTDVQSKWSGTWSDMASVISSSWRGFIGSVSSGAADIISWVSGIPGRISGALAGLGGMLVGHGNAIMSGFLSGLQNSWGAVQDFVGGIAGWIAEHKGPISYDKVLLTPAGEAIMNGLMTGLQNRMGALKTALETVTSTLTDVISEKFAKSTMYLAGAEAALGLADGLSANAAAVDGAFAALLPASGVSISGAGSALPVGNTTIVNVQAGAIPVTTPTKDPELVASKVIDGFAGFSNF